MFQFFQQIRDVLAKMPLSRKIAVGALLFVVISLFAGIIFWSNMVEYRSLYRGLSPEDASQVVTRLKELKIPYKLESGGSGISVPADKLYDLRLSMASEGLPKGSGVGFEIFNKTEFGTTEFVQKLNFQRALQGELARTIREIEEVRDARVLIVMPKDSVFVEESKPPSASVLLKLRKTLPQSQVEAIVHLVASSVEDLTPDRVTVVDSRGKILSSGTPEDADKQLLNSQLSYKLAYERNVTQRIQSMLERIVGQGKCIVRVTVDMDFSRVDVSEELFDPDGQVVRSRQNVAEKSDKTNVGPDKISSVNPLADLDPNRKTESKQRNDDTVNYEISRTTRRTTRPLGEVMRISVAAVLDGTYTTEISEDGTRSRKYVPRSAEEMKLFTTIVRQAMGYSSDREDQVSVESMPFTMDDDWELEQPPAKGVDKLVDDYGKLGLNLLAILLVFLFVVRPLIRTLREVNQQEEDDIFDEDDDGVTVSIGGDAQADGVLRDGTPQERAMRLVREDVDKAANIIKGWLGEE
ncbi:flagellar basal-body MS-ring/collar protein FliF [Desulfoluna butyratoxydans]|uniref:Flagellar M-ring protein n=1 Tax=Desulfoluna butyratoxydans TaxID=231438 RepID=A0A4U8YK93_9BACT|nr:flagellar basal-body MS-ring/collar protein FliF [Desulfoluna butyratoxydans]VFQ43519.1 flagellar m-ring protein flif [Desulfoluna butyratoxydans]